MSMNNLSFKKWIQYDIVIAALLLIVVPPLFFHEGATYVSRLFILLLIFALLTMALNIVFGHTDQLFLFLGALTGISGYSTALTADYLGVSPWLTLLPSAVLVGVIGAIVCYVAARRQVTVIVMAILTLAIQLAVIEVFVGARSITGGSTGFRFSGLGLEMVQKTFGVHEHVVLYYSLVGIVVASLLFYRTLLNSNYGMAFDVIRQDELGAEAMGINVVKYKTLAGFISAFMVGIVGPFYIQLEGYISPHMFEFRIIDVLVLIMLIVGGLRTMYGPLLGAALVIYINEQLQAVGQWRTVIFGLLLIVLFLAFRQGIVPHLKRVLQDRLRLPERIENLQEG